MKEAVLELNASNDRGIDTVRNKIKMFAQQKVTLPPGRHKIVILDEADRWDKNNVIHFNITGYKFASKKLKDGAFKELSASRSAIPSGRVHLDMFHE